jgi:hypothetical protein
MILKLGYYSGGSDFAQVVIEEEIRGFKQEKDWMNHCLLKEDAMRRSAGSMGPEKGP